MIVVAKSRNDGIESCLNRIKAVVQELNVMRQTRYNDEPIITNWDGRI